MNDPELYTKYNKLPQHDVKELLLQFASKIRWKMCGSKVLDIGCGDGKVTEILKNTLPYNCNKLIGTDISEKMVQFANKHYADERAFFVKHDIEADVPEMMKGAFDHVFSFYTLHWIRKQRLAMSNIYNMIADGGDCLLMFIASSSIFAVYRLLAQNPKWAPWLMDAERYISPYQDSSNPEEKFRIIMKEVGFNDIEVICQHKSYVYTGADCVDYVKGLVAAVSPFKVPAAFLDEYLDDYIDVAVEHNLMKKIFNNRKELVSLSYEYSLLVAYERKN